MKQILEQQLQRFIKAQQQHYQIALSEIQAGQKSSHWMWYIFPQIAGLGYSEMAKHFAIKDRHEAIAYLAHPLLGQRLIAISSALLQLKGNSAHAVFGSPDDLKLHSSMTLFAQQPNADPVFKKVLEKYFDGQLDQRTLALLNNPESGQ